MKKALVTITAITALVVTVVAPTATGFWANPNNLHGAGIGEFEPPPYPEWQGQVPEHFPPPFDNEGISLTDDDGNEWIAERDWRGQVIWRLKAKHFTVDGHSVWMLNADTAIGDSNSLPTEDPWVIYGINNECEWWEWCNQAGVC